MEKEEFYKKLLLKEREEIISELNQLGLANPELENDWFARPSNTDNIETRDEVAERIEELNERKATENNLELRLKKINNALQKIETNSYGFCEICEEKIDKKRLEINPAATTCREHFDQEENLL